MGSPQDLAELARENRKKYLKAPTWEQIESFINELETSVNQFEGFYDIPTNTLNQVKSGARKLPSAYWGIIYAKIKPAYGSGFIQDYLKMESEKAITHPITTIAEETTEIYEKTEQKPTHKRLNRLK